LPEVFLPDHIVQYLQTVQHKGCRQPARHASPFSLQRVLIALFQLLRFMCAWLLLVRPEQPRQPQLARGPHVLLAPRSLLPHHCQPRILLRPLAQVRVTGLLLPAERH
jgi:hypothetical protein